MQSTWVPFCTTASTCPRLDWDWHKQDNKVEKCSKWQTDGWPKESLEVDLLLKIFCPYWFCRFSMVYSYHRQFVHLYWASQKSCFCKCFRFSFKKKGYKVQGPMSMVWWFDKKQKISLSPLYPPVILASQQESWWLVSGGGRVSGKNNFSGVK